MGEANETTSFAAIDRVTVAFVRGLRRKGTGTLEIIFAARAKCGGDESSRAGNI
jgi:hypothetical protein